MSRRTVAHLESIQPDGTRGLALWVRLGPRERYLVFSVGLILAYSVLFLFYVPGKTDDYWDHTAAVRAMIENLRTPAHPLFAGPYTGDRGFNPYLLFLAIFSCVTGLSSFSVLKVGAIVNLLLLCTGVYLFAASYAKSREAAVWMLVAYLFFWTTRGATMREWAYYPSFFVMSVTFLFWYVVVGYLRNGTQTVLYLAIAVGWVLWLSHQLQAGVAFGNGILLAYLDENASRARRWMVALVLPMLVIALGECWPYFSSLKFLLRDFANVGIGNREAGHTMAGELRFYSFILGPNVLGILLVMLIKPSTRLERFLRVSIMCSFVSWAVLFLVQSQYATTVVGNIGNMAAMRVGLALTPLTSQPGGFIPLRSPRDRQIRNGLLVVLSLTMLLQVKYTLGWIRQFYWTAEGTRYRQMVSDYTHMLRYIGPLDVVLSDTWTSWQLPTFTGKIISRPAGHQLDYNVRYPELRHRAADLETFFAPETPDEVRRSLIEKYGVKFVLINRVLTSGMDSTSFAEWGSVIFASNAFTLIAVPRHDLSTSSWPFRSQT